MGAVLEVVLAALPILAFFACPIMMALCFFGMRKMGGDAPPLMEAEAVAQIPEERVAVLQQQLHAIQAELTTLQGRDGLASSAVTRGDENPPVDVVPGTVHAG